MLLISFIKVISYSDSFSGYIEPRQIQVIYYLLVSYVIDLLLAAIYIQTNNSYNY